jgi:phosphatidylserine decarboxylase
LRLQHKTWDDFFARLFQDGPVQDPTNEDMIVNACESAPLRLEANVKLTDTFWLKGQPYNIKDEINYHELLETDVGATSYQAFLSALSFYHR